MSKKLKITIISVSVAVVLIVAAIITVVLVVRAYDEYIPEKIAVDAVSSGKFDEVLLVASVRNLQNLSKNGVCLIEGVYSPNQDEFSFYYTYVLGVKDGQEIAYLYPRWKYQQICKSEWIFDKSFREISQMVENQGSNDYYSALMYNDKYSIRDKISQADGLHLDKDIALRFHDKAVVQVDGQIVILQVDANK